MLRDLRLPFVVTVATVSACAGKAIVDGEAQDGAGGTSASGSNGTTDAVVGSTTTGNDPQCPPSWPEPYVECTPSSSVCTYDVPCQSGTVAIGFQCVSGYWETAETPCTLPYDSCAGTDYYCDGSWWMPTGTNPPSPCPDAAPRPLEPCFTGDFGGVWENCGYYCSPGGSTWTIATCVAGPDGNGAWQYDEACKG
jgi:hypothetical protein